MSLPSLFPSSQFTCSPLANLSKFIVSLGTSCQMDSKSINPSLFFLMHLTWFHITSWIYRLLLRWSSNILKKKNEFHSRLSVKWNQYPSLLRQKKLKKTPAFGINTSSSCLTYILLLIYCCVCLWNASQVCFQILQKKKTLPDFRPTSYFNWNIKS